MAKKENRRKPFILGVIPARGGSKGIKRKNLRSICGKPLVYWSIAAAKDSKLLDRFVVSTEDEEIKNTASHFNAEVLDRPQHLASDSATTVSLLQHIVKNDIKADIIVLLQPTSPIRDGALIDRCIRGFLDNKGDVAATGFNTLQYEWGTNQNVPRQKLKGWFYDDGNVYVFKSSLLKRGIWAGGKKIPVAVDKIYNYEIDDEIDILIVEALLGRFLQRQDGGS